MRFCPTCRRPRIEGRKACSGCGRSFPSGLASLPGVMGFGDGNAAARVRSLSTVRPATFVALAITLVAGGTGALWLLGGHRPAQPPAAASPPVQAHSTSPAGNPPSSASAAPTPQASSPSAIATGGQNAITVTASAERDPAASSVAALLEKYFTAINTHNYRAYQALYVPEVQQGMTRENFRSGYRGTVDFAERLVGISTAANGDTQATSTFTSHQDPDAADNYETCTRWRISLFLTQGADGYLIDVAPLGYHAASAACS